MQPIITNYDFQTVNIKNILMKGVAFILIFFSMSFCLFSQNKDTKCLVESRAYPGKDPYMWDALYAAKNGKVYTGLCTEGQSAHFYVYDPVQDKNILLYDMAEFMNERGKGIRTTGKIHNKPVEDNE